MERRQFVQLSVATSILTSTALSDNVRKETLITAGSDRDGEPFQLLDATFQVKVSGVTPRVDA
jgi:hypothetical protein